MISAPKAKTIWKDNHAAGKNRWIKILNEANAEGMVRIQTCFASLTKGFMPVEVESGQISWARLDRFNGTSDGYAYAAMSIHEFRRNKMHLVGFTRQLAKMPKSVVEVGTGEVGEFWMELESRHIRIVEVLGEENGKRQIVTRFYSNIVGKNPTEIVAAKPSHALTSRFNGKSGGYRFLAKNLVSLNKCGILEKPYLQKNDVYVLERIISSVGVPVAKGQLWHDTSITNRARMVTIVDVTETEVEIRSTYVGPSAEGEEAARLAWARSETIAMADFADKRFALVAA